MKKIKNMKIKTTSVEDTMKVAGAFAKSLSAGDIVLLSGDLGAGKTVFTRGFVKGLGINDDVVSPTFTIMNEYGDGRVNHFDLYRLNSIEEFESTGAQEALYSDAISIVEWPEIVGFDYFHGSAYVVKIEKLSDSVRNIEIKRN